MPDPLMRSIRDPIFPLMVSQGEMAVVLSNEHVARVLRPGKYRRLRDLPFRGVKRIIRFTTHETSIPVPSVALVFRDPDNKTMTYPASVAATAVVQFSADSLLMERAVARFDPDQMDEQIRRTVVDTVTVHLRRTLQAMRHEDVVAAADLGPEVGTPDSHILDGLLTVARVENIRITPNAELAELERVRREALVKIEEAEIEATLEDFKSSRSLERDGERRRVELITFTRISQETGIPLDVVINPGILASNAQALHELRIKLVENPDSMRIVAKQPDLLRALTGGQDQQPAWPADVAPELQTRDGELELGYDTTVGRLLGDASSEIGLRGSVVTQFAVRGARAAEVILVSDNPDAAALVTSRLRISLREKTGADTVAVQLVEYRPILADFIAVFYRGVAPPQASNYRSLSLTSFERNNRQLLLRIHVDGAHRSVAEIVRGEDDRRSEQLQSLLMADRISIEVV